MDWLSAERPNLIGAVRQAAEQGIHGYAWKLALVLWRYLYERGHYEEILETQAQALAASEKSGDLVGAAVAHNYLGSAYHVFGRLDRAKEHVNTSIALWEEVCDDVGVYLATGNLASVLLELGPAAGGHRGGRDPGGPAFRAGAQRPAPAEQCRRGIRRPGRPFACAAALSTGPFRRAAYRRRNADPARARARGKVRSLLGHTDPALRLLHAAIAGKIRLDNPYGVREAHNDLARVYRTMGRLTEAERHHRIALEGAPGSATRISGRRY